MYLSICYGCEGTRPAKPPTGTRLPARFCDFCRTPKKTPRRHHAAETRREPLWLQ